MPTCDGYGFVGGAACSHDALAIHSHWEATGSACTMSHIEKVFCCTFVGEKCTLTLTSALYDSTRLATLELFRRIGTKTVASLPVIGGGLITAEGLVMVSQVGGGKAFLSDAVTFDVHHTV